MEKLKDTTTRAVINLYWSSEVERLDKAVYTPLAKRFPSLKGKLEKMKEIKDPIQEMDEMKMQIAQWEVASSLVGLMEAFLVDEDEDTKSIKTMMDKIEPICALYEDWNEKQEKFYVATSKAIQDVALNKGIKPEDVVKNQDYMDEVIRLVFPTREEAEDYLLMSQKFVIEMLDIGKGFIAFVKKSGRANEELLEAEKSIPTKKAHETVNTEVLEYKAKEFDRIYS